MTHPCLILSYHELTNYSMLTPSIQVFDSAPRHSVH